MVSVCTVPARGGMSCEHFGGDKTINRIPFYLFTNKLPLPLMCNSLCMNSLGLVQLKRSRGSHRMVPFVCEITWRGFHDIWKPQQTPLLYGGTLVC